MRKAKSSAAKKSCKIIANKSTADRSVWLCVFEVADSEGPRRFPDKPCCIAEQKVIKPGPALDAWLKKAQSGKHDKLVRVLYEEMPAADEPGGPDQPFALPADQGRIEAALRRLRERLRCKGYTVHGDTTLFGVYVIELDDSDLRRKPKNYKGYVYVGQTILPLEERVLKHQLGKSYPWKKKAKHSKTCHRRFVRFAPELIPKRFREPIACRKKALWAERDLRLSLIAKGYEVEGGTELLPKDDEMARK